MKMLFPGLPLGYNGVQIFKKNFFFETRCTKFPSFNKGMCTGYSVHFVCTLYGGKMLAALAILPNQKVHKKILRHSGKKFQIVLKYQF